MTDFTKLVGFLKVIPPEIAIIILDDLPTQYLDLFRRQEVHPELLDYMIEERFLGYKQSPMMMERRDFSRINNPKYHTFEYQPAVKTPSVTYNDETWPKIPTIDIWDEEIAIDVINQNLIDELHERQVQYAERTYGTTRFDLIDSPRDQFYYTASKLPRHSYFDSPVKQTSVLEYENMLLQYYTKDYDTRDYQRGVFESEVAAGICKVLVEPEHQPITNSINKNVMAKQHTITTEVTGSGRAESLTYGEHYPKNLRFSKKEIKDLRKTLNEDQINRLEHQLEMMNINSTRYDRFVLNRPRNILRDLQKTSAETAKNIINDDGTVQPFVGPPFIGYWWQRSKINEYSKEDLEEAEREYHRYFSENKEDLMNYIRV